MNHKAHFFSIPQFYFLIVQHNLSGLVFFEQISNYIPKDQEIAEAVVHLAEESILLPSEQGAYCLDKEVKSGLDVLDRAQYTCVINGFLSSCPMECLYMAGTACLSVQMDDLRKGYVRVEALSCREAWTQLLEYDFMPDSYGHGAAKVDLKYAEHLAEIIPGLDIDVRTVLADEHIRLVVDSYQRGASLPDLRAAVYSDEGTSLLSVRTAGAVTVNEYSRPLFLKYFEEGYYGFGGYFCPVGRPELQFQPERGC